MSIRWDPSRVLGSPVAVEAIRDLGERLRSARYVNRFGALQVDDPADRPLVDLALGRVTTTDVATRLLGGADALASLVATGCAQDVEGTTQLAFEVLSDGRAMAILPFGTRDGDVDTDAVYAGSDTWLLRDQAWRFGLGGGRAAEFGTGSGLVASFLTARYETVVATDTNTNAVLTARLALELLDEASRQRATILLGDVSVGIRPGSFDFVCGNAPWVPTERSKGRLYADGGTTGFDTPSRFIEEGAALLAPGGTVVVLCIDLTLSDGSEPLHSLLAELRQFGFTTRIESTREPHPFHRATDDAEDVFPWIDRAQHVTVVVHRPR